MIIQVITPLYQSKDIIAREARNARSQITAYWQKWDPWSKCTKTCDGGLQTRKRHCKNEARTPLVKNMTKECFGKPRQERKCHQNACKGKYIFFQKCFPLIITYYIYPEA